MNFEKFLTAIKWPLLVVVCAAILMRITGFFTFPPGQIPVIFDLGIVISIFLISGLATVWAGYRITKAFSANIFLGAIGGAIFTLTLSLFNLLSWLAIAMINWQTTSIAIGEFVQKTGTYGIYPYEWQTFGIFGIVFVVVFLAQILFGAILGAIGGFIAKIQNKSSPSE